MSKFRLIYSTLSVIAVVAGLGLSFWPLCLSGLLIAAAAGQYVLVVCIGIFLDVLYGPPVCFLHVLRVPFMLVSIVLCVTHYYVAFYLREGNTGRL